MKKNVNLNSILLRNFDSFKKLSFSEKLKLLKPWFDNNRNNRSSCNSFTKEQKYEIDNTNKYFLNKLKQQKSVLDLGKWEKDFQKSRAFKKNICIYPYIDFHKSLQRKIEEQKTENQKIYSNTTMNLVNNLFNKTKFKEVKLFEKKEKKDDKKIDNEHFLNGETQIPNDDRKFGLYFLVSDKNKENEYKKIKIENCKKDDFFSDVVDKLCQIETTIDKNKMQIDDFTIKGRNDQEEYIDYNDTLEGNKLNGDEEIIVKFKNDKDKEKKNNVLIL